MEMNTSAAGMCWWP